MRTYSSHYDYLAQGRSGPAGFLVNLSFWLAYRERRCRCRIGKVVVK